MKVSTEILDDISNWYVRRNRRRFWKSENDNDKLAAYYTLYNTILVYIKIMSPVIPFVTEKIYQNLVVNINNHAASSIHLTEFPHYNKKNENQHLIDDIDTVKHIVNLGRSVRNKANLKIRQPLSDIKIFIPKGDVGRIKKYNNQILEELNIKKIEYAKKENDLISYFVKPNFNMISKNYSDDKSEIIAMLNNMSQIDILSLLRNGKSVSIKNGSIALSYEYFIIDEIPLDGYCVASNNHIIVSINTLLDKDLINEGMIRDLIRKIQNLRKDSNFRVDDRIIIRILAEDKI